MGTSGGSASSTGLSSTTCSSLTSHETCVVGTNGGSNCCWILLNGAITVCSGTQAISNTGGSTAGVTSSEKLGLCYDGTLTVPSLQVGIASGVTALNTGGTDPGAASVVEFAVGTLCSAGP